MAPEPYPPVSPSENVTVRPPLKKLYGVYFRICLACKYRACLYFMNYHAHLGRDHTLQMTGKERDLRVDTTSTRLGRVWLK